MNKTEEEIYNEIIKRIAETKYSNEIWLKRIGGNKRSSDFLNLVKVGFYKTEYTYLDFLDGRKNLITIDNFCRYTGEKVSKAKIKRELKIYYLTK